MRILADMRSHVVGPTPLIVQVEDTPPEGAPGRVSINGRYAISLPPGVDIPITDASYILPVDGGDVSSLAFDALLAQYPAYQNIVFNSLLRPEDVDELDLAAMYNLAAPLDPPEYVPVRAQVGRGVGANSGLAPMMVAVAPFSLAQALPHPGILITKDIPLAFATTEVVVYWKCYDFDVTQDISASAGAFAGQNSPALRYLEETPPTGLFAYLSVNGGDEWLHAPFMEPVSLGMGALTVRVAFVNVDITERRYLANFAVLF